MTCSSSRSCSTCNCSPCSCSNSCTTPYYDDVDTCAEDNCQKIYVNQFAFGMCPEDSWNVPLCGQTAVLNVAGVTGAPIGSYIWHPSYGYFQIQSVSTKNGTVSVVNNCTTGNATPGTQIPKCTCFSVVGPPVEGTNPSDLFPYLAVDFTAPGDGLCVPITVTTTNGLAVGDTITIGSGQYTIDSFLGNNVINICNDGLGIAPGTAVIAQDAFGNYQYPLYVIDNCCSTIDATIAAAIAGYQNQKSASIWGGTSVGSANAQSISLTPAYIGAYVDGLTVRWIAGFTNTSSVVTFNVDGVGANPLTRQDGSLFLGDIFVGYEYESTFVGGNWVTQQITPAITTFAPTITVSSGAGTLNTIVVTYANYSVGIGKIVTVNIAATFTVAGAVVNEVKYAPPVSVGLTPGDFWGAIIVNSGAATQTGGYVNTNAAFGGNTFIGPSNPAVTPFTVGALRGFQGMYQYRSL